MNLTFSSLLVKSYEQFLNGELTANTLLLVRVYPEGHLSTIPHLRAKYALMVLQLHLLKMKING